MEATAGQIQSLSDATFAELQRAAIALGLPLGAGVGLVVPFDQCPDQAVEQQFREAVRAAVNCLLAAENRPPSV